MKILKKLKDLKDRTCNDYDEKTRRHKGSRFEYLIISIIFDCKG